MKNSASPRFFSRGAAALGGLALLWCSAPALLAQTNRIAGPIRDNRIALRGYLHPKAESQFDRGRVDPSFEIPSLTLVLNPSDSQQADLEKLLAQQQDSSSPNYHRWLTPEEYADRFGVSQGDLTRIVAWLKQGGVEVTGTSRARNSISFRGTAAQVEQALGTEFHRYDVNGEVHFANATEPSIPGALQAVVRGIRGLNDFRMKPQHSPLRPLATEAPLPNYTSSVSKHYLAPADVTAIYNVRPLYSAGVDGSGQKLVVVGQTRVDVADIQKFRTRFSLPANDPQMVLVPGFKDPGVSTDDLGEADLDLEWAGALAPGASLIYVYSYNVQDAVQYAIDQNFAPVISMSYGLCEALTSSADTLSLRSMARQANAQGITWIASSGDNGGADCAGSGSRFDNTLAVDLPASLPEVTGVGGTEFAEGTGNYWSSSNDSSGGSVLSRIPETTWNDSSSGNPASGGGGASVVFAKPAWQTGAGVPNDGARDVPDVALASSATHDGFLIYSSGNLQVVGGTSVAAPVFAGITALVNHQLVSSGVQSSSGLGNINAKLYTLAQTTPSAFHDVTTGDNIVSLTCSSRSRNCTPGSFGYAAGAGYDLATGLGSVDAFNLAAAWRGDTGAIATPPNPPASGPPSIGGLANGASFTQAYAPGMLLSIFGSQLAPSVASAGSVPLPLQLAGVSVTVNGVTAPLYYVSPGQLNIQVPYETPSNSSAVVVVNNNGQTASVHLPVGSVAPGIFTDQNGAPVPNASAARGKVATLFFTGAGALSPAVPTGAAPAAGTAVSALPKPQLGVTVSVGGQLASIQFVGTTAGLVGVTQVNYVVPAGAPLGSQSVLVFVGGVASSAAKLTVTN